MGTKTLRSQSRTLLARAPIALALGALAAQAAGCGGGGSSGGSPTGLAFSVAWEQRVNPGAASVTSFASDGAALGFEEDIPASVNAIRFVLTPPSGGACCVAILRGSQPFIDRHIVLAGVVPGEGSLEVNGYPTNFAPADGVSQTCDTRGAGSSCSSQRTLPSFGSGGIEIDVIEGITNVVDVDVHSLPFLLDLDPGDGETADENRPHVTFTVVDANHGIDEEDIDVLITQGELSTGVEFDSIEDCADGDTGLPDCSPGGALDVRGVQVATQSQVPLEEGLANLQIEASNTAPTPRSMESDTTFNVPPDIVSTTTSTAPPSSTTSTTEEEPPATFCLEFAVNAPEMLLGLSYEVSYGETGGEFTGSGEDVSCVSLLNPQSESVLTTFNDEEGTSTLLSGVISAEPFSVPIVLAQCEFTQVPPLAIGSFSIQVTEATAANLTSTTATVSVTETTCPL